MGGESKSVDAREGGLGGRTDGYHREFDAVEVLDLAARAEWRAWSVHGYIDVAAERAL